LDFRGKKRQRFIVSILSTLTVPPVAVSPGHAINVPSHRLFGSGKQTDEKKGAVDQALYR